MEKKEPIASNIIWDDLMFFDIANRYRTIAICSHTGMFTRGSLSFSFPGSIWPYFPYDLISIGFYTKYSFL